jgi:cobalt/nickel transport system ATP-binding protein
LDIAAIDMWANSGASRLHRASAAGKGIGAMAFVAAVVLASSPYLLASIYLLLLAGVFASRLPARRLVEIAAYPTIFAILFAISRWDGGFSTPAVILLKTLTAAQAMVLLITTTPYTDLFAAVGRVMPGLLADGLFVTYRSFFVLLREMGRMLTALRLRGGLRPRRYVANTRNVSRAMGMLLVRGVDLSERLYSVLRVRGYRGRIQAGDRWRRTSPSDALPLVAGAVALALALLATVRPAVWASINGPVLLAAGLVALLGLAVSKMGGQGDTERPHPSFGRPLPGGEAVTTSPLPMGEGQGEGPLGKAETRRQACEQCGGSLATCPIPAEHRSHHSHGVARREDEVARVSCVRHVYPDGTEVSLCGLDFVAHRGERVVILGPNGAGKSTLLNHLLGLLRPMEGEVTVLGHDPSREFAAIQPRLGVLLQDVDDQLLGPTVADDVAFGARNAGFSDLESRAMAAKAMDQLGVLQLADKVPHYLSGGQKRKVALAGALVTNPDLLVLDEPFEGLDPRSRGELVALLTELQRRRGLTIILTTHHVDLLPILADTVYLLADGGRIVASGTPDEVFSLPDVLRESAIDPPVLTLLFQRLNEEGIELGMPSGVEDATRRLLDRLK